MYKTYTIKAYKFKEISEGIGSISYYLVDELGEERVVTAKAKRGVIKKIKSVQAIHHRETPLVNALANSSVNDTIVVDFSSFNRKFPRVSNGSQFRKTAKAVVNDFDNSRAATTMDSLSIDKIRLLQLFIIACLCLMVIMAISNLWLH